MDNKTPASSAKTRTLTPSNQPSPAEVSLAITAAMANFVSRTGQSLTEEKADALMQDYEDLARKWGVNHLLWLMEKWRQEKNKFLPMMDELERFSVEAYSGAAIKYPTYRPMSEAKCEDCAGTGWQRTKTGSGNTAVTRCRCKEVK